jgi:hypothetical protein
LNIEHQKGKLGHEIELQDLGVVLEPGHLGIDEVHGVVDVLEGIKVPKADVLIDPKANAIV